MNVERTIAAGGLLRFWQPIVSVTADEDAYAEIRERIYRGVRVNRAPEMALALPPPPVCPYCSYYVEHLERPIHHTLSIAVRCGNCGWSGRARLMEFHGALGVQRLGPNRFRVRLGDHVSFRWFTCAGVQHPVRAHALTFVVTPAILAGVRASDTADSSRRGRRSRSCNTAARRRSDRRSVRRKCGAAR